MREARPNTIEVLGSDVRRRLGTILFLWAFRRHASRPSVLDKKCQPILDTANQLGREIDVSKLVSSVERRVVSSSSPLDYVVSRAAYAERGECRIRNGIPSPFAFLSLLVWGLIRYLQSRG